MGTISFTSCGTACVEVRKAALACLFYGVHFMSEEKKIRTSKGMGEHWCMHNSCKKWGSFGFQGRYGQLWFCMEHKKEGDKEAK